MYSFLHFRPFIVLKAVEFNEFILLNAIWKKKVIEKFSLKIIGKCDYSKFIMRAKTGNSSKKLCANLVK